MDFIPPHIQSQMNEAGYNIGPAKYPVPISEAYKLGDAFEENAQPGGAKSTPSIMFSASGLLATVRRFVIG